MLPNSASEIQMTNFKQGLDSFGHSPTFTEFLLWAVSILCQPGEYTAFEGLIEKNVCIDGEIEFGNFLGFFQF